MQNRIDLLKAATKQTIRKKHLTFLFAHISAFYVYLLALVTASLLIHEAKGKSLRVPFYRDYWQPGTVVSMRYLKTVRHEYFPSSNLPSSPCKLIRTPTQWWGSPRGSLSIMSNVQLTRPRVHSDILPVAGWAVSPQSCQPLSWARVTPGPLSLKLLGRKGSIAATGYICCIYNCCGIYHCSSSKIAYKVFSLLGFLPCCDVQSATAAPSFRVWELSKKQSHK